MVDIAEMLIEYNNIATSVEESLKTMLNLVAEGRVPSQESIVKLERVLADLQSKYSSIKGVADNADRDRSASISDASVYDYLKLIEQCQNIKIKERLAGIEAQMRNFISVKSLVEKYAKILLPFQEEAADMLKQLEQISSAEIPDSLIQAADNQNIFLQAVARDNFDDDEGEAILDELNAAFHPIVTQGILRKKYFISAEESVGAEEVAQSKPKLNERNEESHIVEDSVLDSENASVESEVEHTTGTSDKNAITERLPDKYVPIIPVKISALNRIKEISASASAFKNEINKLGKVVRSLLPMFTNLGALLDTQVFAIGRYLECFAANESKAVEIALSQLASKNILAEYDFENSGTKVYCLTTYGYNCMHKESIATAKKMWDLSIGKVQICGKAEMELEPLLLFVSNNADLLAYLAWCRSEFDDMVCRNLRSAITWCNTHYSVALSWQECKYICELQHSFDGFCGGSNYIVVVDEDELIPDTMACPVDCSVFCLKNGVMSEWKSKEELFSNTSSIKNEQPRFELAATDATGSRIVDDSSEQGVFPTTEDTTDPNEEITQELFEDDASFESHNSITFDPDEVSVYGLLVADSSMEYAQKVFDKNLSPDHYYIFINLIDKLIQENKSYHSSDVVENSIARAIVLAKALSVYDEVYVPYYHQLLLALDSPVQEHIYTGDAIFARFESYQPGFEPKPILKLMSLLRAMFAPETAYDYALSSYTKSLFDNFESEFEGYDALKPLYNLFLRIADESANGFSVPVLRSFSDTTEEQNLLNQIKSNAHQAISEPFIKSGLKCMGPMIRNCFGAGSNLRDCMEIISEDRRDDREYVEVIFSDFCVSSNGKAVISADSMNIFFDEKWKESITEIHGPRDLNAAQKAKVIEHIHTRLILMERWLQITDNTNRGTIKSGKLMNLRKEILLEIKRLLPIVKHTYTPYDSAIVQAGLKPIMEKLSGQLLNRTYEFADFLQSGIFCVDDTYVPFVDDLFSSYRYYEPWRNALRHIATPVMGLHKTLDEIANPDNLRLYDNIGQAITICKYLHEVCDENITIDQYSGDIDAVKISAKDALKSFRDDLELAFAYGRISETEKEDILEGLNLAYEKFDEYQNYGCMRAFLESLRHVMDDAASVIYDGLKQDIEERMKANTVEKMLPILEHALMKLSEPERNFVVAEEYINRYDAGNSDNIELSDALDSNAFLNFVDTAFDELYTLCQKNQNGIPRSFGIDYVENKLRKMKVSAQYQDSSRILLKSMPNRPDEVKPTNMLILLKELGFDATSVRIIQTSTAGSTMVLLSADVNPDAKDKAEYAHPVDIMGTKLKSPMDIICLFGRMQANDIVNKVCSLELNRTAIVFLNGALDIQSRRQIAERFHREKSGQNPFLLIDWVLLLHLALHQRTERLPVLLSCSLPYTSSFQPFVLNGSVSDEMFIGRKKELNQILDPNGPVIVYGGRQLGKTALLERALSRASHPLNKEYAILVRAVGLDTEELLVSAIVQELNMAGVLVPEVFTTRELCQELRISYHAKKWTKLLVLVDESDAMLAAFSTTTPAYKPIFAFANLVRETSKDFKFVFAGLHNVCRAATDPNSVFGQFGEPLCIKPLRASDAHELLSRPLRYMGFAIDAAHLEHILVNTSFYPGIVHYVGYSLVENLSTKYADYYQASRGNPPYDLTDKQLGAIMSGDALNEKINERIRWTLQVDPRYFMLARCVTYLYYDNPDDNKIGHSVDSIREYAYLLEISCLDGLNRQDYISLLNEMVEMGILVMPSTDHYRLRQRKFMEAIGSSREKIESDIRIAEGGRNA